MNYKMISKMCEQIVPLFLMVFFSGLVSCGLFYCDSSTRAQTPANSAQSRDKAPAAVPQSMANLFDSDAGQESYKNRTGSEWRKYYFGSGDCSDSAVCGGLADPDNDGLNNNEEYRFGTDPKHPDTDHDGRGDGEEIVLSRDPLVAGSPPRIDEIFFESVKTAGEVRNDIYQVNNVEYVTRANRSKGVKISGKALPDIYVNVYVYSKPVVTTVKTDSNGNWSLVLDEPLAEGNHEVYVAANDNTGKVIAKSKPLRFMQTARAVTLLPSEMAPAEKSAASPSRSGRGYLLIGLFIFCGSALALVIAGLVKTKD